MSSHRPPQLPGAFVVQPGRGVTLVVFDPHPLCCVIPQSKRVIRVPGHVLNVAVQAHAGIEKHGDGRPGPLLEAALQEVVHGSAGLSQARGSGDPDHTPVQQLHEIGFGGLVRDDPAGLATFGTLGAQSAVGVGCHFDFLARRVPLTSSLRHHGHKGGGLAGVPRYAMEQLGSCIKCAEERLNEGVDGIRFRLEGAPEGAAAPASQASKGRGKGRDTAEPEEEKSIVSFRCLDFLDVPWVREMGGMLGSLYIDTRFTESRGEGPIRSLRTVCCQLVERASTDGSLDCWYKEDELPRIVGLLGRAWSGIALMTEAEEEELSSLRCARGYDATRSCFIYRKEVKELLRGSFEQDANFRDYDLKASFPRAFGARHPEAGPGWTETSTCAGCSFWGKDARFGGLDARSGAPDALFGPKMGMSPHDSHMSHDQGSSRAGHVSAGTGSQK
ncbi:hypothetical protein AK812_SmicGene16329 [Symbiodinium microadriaticum]|uniref:Uncharacterized protein n=1 Tax=Symbiodinium microadriaticum TaxID=2951 RepID=A0A1Q9E0K9_SYMMI|nr:hypothetical protein AK812_SmicGene16329 [Symbiodinium microadriaticum]